MHRKIYSYNHSGKGNINALKKMTVEEQKNALTEVSKHKLRLETALAKLSEASKQTPKFKDLQAKLQKIETLIVELKAVLPASAISIPGFVHINPGKFKMGATDLNKKIVKDVEITKHFEMQKAQVTQKQFLRIMKYNPSRFKDKTEYPAQEQYPVETVSWFEANEVALRLSLNRLALNEKQKDKLTGFLNEIIIIQTTISHDRLIETDEYQKALLELSDYRQVITEYCNYAFTNEGEGIYRLPTEAEWEYCAKTDADNKYGTSTGKLTPEVAVYAHDGNRIHHPEPVKSTPANKWNLFGMCGNVGQWCSDLYQAYVKNTDTEKDPLNLTAGSFRVVRGGSWGDAYDKHLRSSYREFSTPDNIRTYDGFRLARTCPE